MSSLQNVAAQLAVTFFFMLCAVTSPAHATFLTGNQLFDKCHHGSPMDHSELIDFGYCVGFITGVVDGSRESMEKFGAKPFCMPNGVLPLQLLDTAVGWLRRNPQFTHYTASSLVAASMSEAFPCA